MEAGGGEMKKRGRHYLPPLSYILWWFINDVRQSSNHIVHSSK